MVKRQPSESHQDRKRQKLEAGYHHGDPAVDDLASAGFEQKVSALLEQCKVDYAGLSELQHTLRTLKVLFEKAKPLPPQTMSDATKSLANDGISIPFVRNFMEPDIRYTFAFAPPSKVSIVGSFLLHTNVLGMGAPNNVDLAVEIPADLFQEKDSGRGHYANKRAYYLACLARILSQKRSSLPPFELQFAADDGDMAHPLLCLAAKIATSDFPEEERNYWVIRIRPTLDPDTFPHLQLAPCRPNLGAAGGETFHSPHYNSVILSDMLHHAHLSYVHKTAEKYAHFVEAVRLGKIWLGRRGLDRESTGFSGFLWTILCCWVVHGQGTPGRPRPPAIPATQLFVLVIESLALRDFLKDPVVLTRDGKPLDAEEFSLASFSKAFEVVMIDSTGRLNLASRMTRSSLALLQHEATLTLECLRHQDDDTFQNVFVQKVDEPILKWDYRVRVTNGGQARSADDPHKTLAQRNSDVSEKLFAALKNRVKLVHAMETHPAPCWSLSQSPPTVHSTPVFAFMIDPSKANDEMEVGPEVGSVPSPSEFSQFWGTKCQVRRFQDGGIRESVVWDDAARDTAEGVFGAMVKWLLETHWGLRAHSALLGGFTSLFGGGPWWRDAKFEDISRQFDDLGRQLRSLNSDLPLAILSVLPASPALRLCSGFPTTLVPPNDVVLVMEHSARWPNDDLDAIQAMKAALCLKIAALLRQKDVSLRATAVSRTASQRSSEEHRVDSHMQSGPHVELVSGSGFIFHLHILAEPEELVLTRRSVDPQLSFETRERYMALLASHHRLFKSVVQHSVAVRRQTTLFPAFASTVRLVKRWVGSHMMSPFFSDEELELLCLRVFSKAAPWKAPAHPVVGLLRVLDLVGNWNWSDRALTVELDEGKLSTQIARDIEAAFKHARQGGNAHSSLTLATETDLTGKLWHVRHSTGWVVLSRFCQLARSAVEMLRTPTSPTKELLQAQNLFRPHLTGFDILVQLESSLVPTTALSAEDKRVIFKNLKVGSIGEPALFRPFESLLSELKVVLGETGLLFYNPHAPNEIGILWNPLSLKERKWSSGIPYSSCMTGGTAKSNVAGLISEIARLSSGIVHRIVVNATQQI